MWEVFRQTYYNKKGHRSSQGQMLCEHIERDSTVLEYGSGVAPYLNYMLSNCPQGVGDVAISDVPAEHFYFALWRLRYKLNALKKGHKELKAYEVGDVMVELPRDEYGLIISITVFEHLPYPLDTAKNMLNSLKPGGLLYEDFCAEELEEGEDLAATLADTSDPNLGSSRVQRKPTLQLFEDNCVLVHGDMGKCTKRLWRCHHGGNVEGTRR